MIQWGIVGTGSIAAQFAKDIRYADVACVRAVASRHQASAERFAADHGIAVACGDYGALYDRDDVDAVYIATPHSCHLENATAALRAGKAVLCEKPLTTTVAECRELMATAAASGGYLAEALWSYFLPAFCQALTWVHEGRIDTPRQLQATFGFEAPFDAESRLFARALGGGCLLDTGIYPIALARALYDRAPGALQVEAKFAPTGVEDEVDVHFDYGEVSAEFQCSFRRALPNSATITGDAGRIELPDFWGATECRLYIRDEPVEHYKDERRGSGLEYEIAAVSRDIAGGRQQSDVMPLSTSLALQEDIERVRAAIADTAI